MFPLRDLVYGESATLLTYSESTGAFSYSSSNPNVAFISGNTITTVSIGLTTITINQAEDNNYNAAQITSLLYVHPIIPMIMFEAKTNGVYYNTIELLAISTNPYSPIIYGFVNNPEIASIEGNILTFNGFGTVAVIAFQPGNEFYTPVSFIRTFTRKNQQLSPSNTLTSFAMIATKDSVTHEQHIPLSIVNRLGPNKVPITNPNITDIFSQNSLHNEYSIRATYATGMLFILNSIYIFTITTV